jgi:cold-inducible RNA-binding protein
LASSHIYRAWKPFFRQLNSFSKNYFILPPASVFLQKILFIMNLFVAGLPYDVDDQELKQIFEEFGAVTSAKVILDKETRKSRGFGFVEMPEKEEAEKAIKGLNGAEMDGRSLAVKEAEDRKNSGGGGGNYNRGGGGGYNSGGGNRDRNRY